MQRSKRASRNPESSESAWAALPASAPAGCAPPAASAPPSPAAGGSEEAGSKAMRHAGGCSDAATARERRGGSRRRHRRFKRQLTYPIRLTMLNSSVYIAIHVCPYIFCTQNAWTGHSKLYVSTCFHMFPHAFNIEIVVLKRQLTYSLRFSKLT